MPESSRISRLRGFRSVPAAVILIAGLAAAPVAAAPGGSGSKHSPHPSDEDSYILSLGNSTTSSNISIDEYARLRGKRAGDFLWFRRAGKAYRIDDPATLSEARALFAPLRALEPEQEDLRRREEALDEKEQDLDRREEDTDRRMELANGEDDDDDDAGPRIAPTSDADRKELERRLSEIRSQQREIEADSRKLESVERSLDAREDAIEREAESKLWTLIDVAVKRGLAKPS